MKPMVWSTLLLTVRIAALAQLQTQAPPVGYSGAVVRFSEEGATLKDKGGKEIVVAMTRGWTVSVARTRDSGAIKPGDFVATANTVVDANTGRSTELRILEPGYRPEFGTHLMGQQVNTAMTHGTVTTATRGAAGAELEVVIRGLTAHYRPARREGDRLRSPEPGAVEARGYGFGRGPPGPGWRVARRQARAF